jgi:hypothetical protein
MNKCRCFFLMVLLLVCFSAAMLAQDSLKTDDLIQRKNILKYNLTPSLLGFKSYIFGYERIIKPYQSFSINIGYLALNEDEKSVNEAYDLIRSNKSKGISVVADYRFYLQKENKYKAPRGIYIGPYFASYLMKSNMTVRSTDTSLGNPEIDIDVKLNIQNIGIQLGYQFLIKNRVTIDLIVVGPSLSKYRFKMSSTGNVALSEPEVEEAIEGLKDILFEKHPWAKNLFNEDGIDVKGNKSTWGLGFRYVLQVGYNF